MKLRRWQQNVIDEFPDIIKNYKKFILKAPTGAGKTVLAIYGIGWCLKNNKKAIYTSPTKSLSNQKYFEFVNDFGDQTSIGIMTGDIKINADAQIVVMTTEILRNLLYKDKNLDGLKTEALINFLIPLPRRWECPQTNSILSLEDIPLHDRPNKRSFLATLFSDLQYGNLHGVPVDPLVAFTP